MKKKLGPLPVWAWGVIFGVAGYLYLRNRSASSSSSSSTSPTASVLDPNAVDPNTGLTYGQEEQAAMANSGLSATAGGAGGGGTLPAEGNLGSTATTLGDNLNNFDAELLAFLQAQQDLQQAAGALGYVSPTTAAAASSPPILAASTPPTTTPTAHTGPAAPIAPTAGAAILGAAQQAVATPLATAGVGTHWGTVQPAISSYNALRLAHPDWGPNTLAAGHQLPHHSVRY